jgi:hypothetical protein
MLAARATSVSIRFVLTFPPLSSPIWTVYWPSGTNSKRSTSSLDRRSLNGPGVAHALTFLHFFSPLTHSPPHAKNLIHWISLPLVPRDVRLLGRYGNYARSVFVGGTSGMDPTGPDGIAVPQPDGRDSRATKAALADFAFQPS